jgi:hypothetical protein
MRGSNEFREESHMVSPVPSPEIPSGAAAARISLQLKTSTEDRLADQLLSGQPPDDPVHDLSLIEMRYQQHLALRDLQELFEYGLLQTLGN